MKRVFYLLLLIAGFVYGMTCGVAGETNIDLKKGWKFHKNDLPRAEKLECNISDWNVVEIPHTWNTDLINGDTYYLGIAWYRKTISITDDMRKKRLFLRFDGVNTIADIYINGKLIGEHKGGYSAFCFEITDNVKIGENLIAVKVDNTFNNDVTPVGNKLFTRFGGIYRPVKLLVRNKVCITPLDYASSGVYLTQKNVSEKSANLEVLTKVSNASAEKSECKLNITIKNAEGIVVKKLMEAVVVAPGKTVPVTAACTIDNPHLWNGKKNPYLYSVEVELIVDGQISDSVIQSLGFRYFHVDPQKGFFLNGEYIDLYGVNRHQEWEKEGSALTDEHHKKDVELILELGANAVRLAHYQQAEKMYELCDKFGLIVWAEVPVTPPYQKGNKAYLDNCRQQLTEIIRQNFNHPSILLWGLYNEVKIPDDDVQTLHDLAKKEDPSRLTVSASDLKLQKKHTIPDLQAWNKYPGWYGRKKNKISEFADTVHEKDPEICVGISEYGAGGCIDQHMQNPKRPNPSKGRFFPEEYQAITHEAAWEDIKDRKDIFCKFIWNMFDFSWPPVSRGNRIHMNHKGLMTYDRKVKKDAFFFYKANWSTEPVLYITSRRHIKRKEQITDIKVYSNTGYVELFVNGESKGTVKPNNIKIALWKGIKLQKGKNSIVTKAVQNGKTITDQCEWEY